MRKLSIIISSLVIMLSMCGCNKQVFDTTYKFNEAMIKMPDGSVISGKLDSWKDYDGDQIQVKIDGVTYLTFSSNVVLISD